MADCRTPLARRFSIISMNSKNRTLLSVLQRSEVLLLSLQVKDWKRTLVFRKYYICTNVLDCNRGIFENALLFSVYNNIL